MGYVATSLPINIFLVGVVTLYLATCGVVSGETHHRTKAASEKQHDLWCYRCNNLLDGDRCLDLYGNLSAMHMKCAKDQKKCQVRRISMSTSTDEVTGKPKLWLLQRNCSESCEAGCIVIGERTKLHSCIECCDERNFCNAGSPADKSHHSSVLVFLLCALILLSVLLPANHPPPCAFR